jgi:plasmid stabilization system protein ParE
MHVELLRGAEADLLELYVRLEEARTGLGERFYRSLDLALGRLRNHPEMAPVYRGSYRRLVLRPFGFGIFYAIESDRVMVGAILDLRQNPESIERRLSR